MTNRFKYIKAKQQNPTNLPANSNGGYLFGEKCIYNSTHKLILLTAVLDQFDSTGSNWISGGSGSVFVYTYNENTGESSLTQKISMPNVAVNGIASLRHSYAYFGLSIDTFQDWLIIGCPGDIYTEEYYGDYVRNDSFIISNYNYDGTEQTIQTGASGSVYFYKWNGSSFVYVNKVRPPLFQDFVNPISQGSFTSNQDPSYISLLNGNGSAFGFSVSIDKSEQTSFSATNPALRKMVAIGAPAAIGVPPEINQQYQSAYRGPFGGVWLAKYNSTLLRWELASDKLNPHSFGGLSSQVASSPNPRADFDFNGADNISSIYDIYDPPSSPYIVPNTGSAAKAGEFSAFGVNVSIGYYNNIKLIVASKEFFNIQDSFGQFSREDNVFYYDLIYNPSHPDINSFVMRNPYGNRQFYTAMDYTNGSLTPGTAQYAESITGYSSFLDRNAVADNVTNVERPIRFTYNNLSRGSAGFCGYPPVVGSTLQTDTGADYVNDTRLFYQDGIGTGDMKQCGRLAFIYTPLSRSSSKIYPLSDPYTTSDYTTAFNNPQPDGDSSKPRVSSTEVCDSIIIVDLNDLNQLKTKGWVLAGPNSWKINASDFVWTGGFGMGFDVQQESPTQWVITTTYLSVYQKSFLYAGSPSNDYVFIVDKAQLKTAIYRLTYDGTSMSMQTIAVIDGKIVNPKVNVTGFDNYSDSVLNDMIIPSISGYPAKKAAFFMHAMAPIRSSFPFSTLATRPYGFVSSALIKNTISNQYHVAEGWCLDNDGTTAHSACGSFNLTKAETYEINPSSFLAFCE